MRLATRDCAGNGSSGEWPALQALCQCRLQQPLRIFQLARSRQVLVRKADDRVAGERARGIGDCCNEPLLGAEMIVLVRLDALACMSFGAQVEAVAERLEQALLEHPQLRLE